MAFILHQFYFDGKFGSLKAQLKLIAKELLSMLASTTQDLGYYCLER